MLNFAHNNPKLIQTVLMALSAVLGVLVQQHVVPDSVLPLAGILLGAGGLNVNQKAAP